MLKSANLIHKWGLGDSDMNSTVGLVGTYNRKRLAGFTFSSSAVKSQKNMTVQSLSQKHHTYTKFVRFFISFHVEKFRMCFTRRQQSCHIGIIATL